MATTVQPAIEFTFQEEGHIYRDTAGQPILSVTQVLDSCGIIDYPDEAKEAMTWKSDLGKAVHTACEFIDTPDKGELDWGNVDSRCVPYILAYETFCEEANFTATHVELAGAVRLPQGPTAFTLDRIGMMGGFSAIVDLKCTTQIEKSCQVQLAGYEDCILALGYKPEGSPTFKRLAVQLKPDGKYKCYPYHDPTDKNVWRWSLALATWKMRQGYRLDKWVER
jgi:hypothetical protein